MRWVRLALFLLIGAHARHEGERLGATLLVRL